ncbi:metalloregulator ArsR/SmtB family transcription factor [Thermopolyspora sp. NPDC052614]|uniref:ArsR/SmtB family transcription factor n=1 Tax=Thermopolyspora sp. NPDC052614 TaxID=3155682 RepID=UPI00342E8039
MAIVDQSDRCVSANIAAGVTPAAALFHSLADETRLRIVQRLAQGEARVVDLTSTLGLAQSTVSKHLACLRGCGLVEFRAEGRQSFYSLTRPELMDLLASAEQLLAATGHIVALRPALDIAPADLGTARSVLGPILDPGHDRLQPEIEGEAVS